MAKDDKRYEQARELTEKAMDAYVKHDDAKGDKLVEKAKATIEQAVRDVNDELEEDAGSEHDAGKLGQQTDRS
jgi:F0F1-type ATP synthase membrane subunit b/b'